MLVEIDTFRERLIVRRHDLSRLVDAETDLEKNDSFIKRSSFSS